LCDELFEVADGFGGGGVLGGEGAFGDEVFEGGVPAGGGDEEARGFGVGDESGGGGDVDFGGVGAEGDDGAEVVSEEEFGGGSFAEEVAEVFDVLGRVGADLGEVADGVGFGAEEEVFVQFELAIEVEGEGVAGEVWGPGLDGGVKAGDVAEDGVDEAAGAGGVAVFAGEVDGGVDGGVVGGAGLEEELVGAEPEEALDVVVEGFEGLLETGGDDGVEGFSPADDAGDEVEGEGSVAGGELGEGFVAAFREERGVGEGGPFAEEGEDDVAGGLHRRIVGGREGNTKSRRHEDREDDGMKIRIRTRIMMRVGGIFYEVFGG
jgi:hypothetical protein